MTQSVSVDSVSGASSRTVWLKIGLSVFLIFHLFAVIIVPNSMNYLGLQTGPILERYVNFFELSQNWSFFAPEPGPPVFVEWEILDAQGEPIEKTRWPALGSTYRKVSLAVFTSTTDEKVDQLMGSYLCRTNPKAGSVRIWRVISPAPTREEVAHGTRKIGDDAKLERQMITHSFCESSASGRESSHL